MKGKLSDGRGVPESPPERAVETCATHGMRFDPTLHDGCVLCRRILELPTAAANSSDAPASGGRIRALQALAGVLAIGAGAFWWLGGFQQAAGKCSAECSRGIESCFARCQGRVEGGGCRDECMAAVGDCLGGCSELKGIAPGEVRFAYAVGDAPEWAAVKDRVEAAMPRVATCQDGRGAFTARFDVRPDGLLARVEAITPFRPTGMCVQGGFASARLTFPPGEYSFVVRGQPPPAPRPQPVPVQPAPTQTRPGVEPPQAIDYLAQVNAMSAKDQAQPMVEAQDSQQQAPAAAQVPIATSADFESMVFRNNFASVQQQLAAGFKIPPDLDVLSTAITAGWPADKLGILLQGGAAPNGCSCGSTIPLGAAVRLACMGPKLFADRDRDAAAVIKTLIAGGADPNIHRDYAKWSSPLHLAAAGNCPLTWQALIDGGANPDLSIGNGETPSQLATKMRAAWAGRR